jgi:hypothetical protein
MIVPIMEGCQMWEYVNQHCTTNVQGVEKIWQGDKVGIKMVALLETTYCMPGGLEDKC